MHRRDAVTTDEIRTVRCAMGEHEVRRISDEWHHGWNVPPPRLFEWTARIEGVRYAPASKVRLSADEIVFVTMCLRPGMVFTSAGTLCVNDSLYAQPARAPPGLRYRVGNVAASVAAGFPRDSVLHAPFPCNSF